MLCLGFLFFPILNLLQFVIASTMTHFRKFNIEKIVYLKLKCYGYILIIFENAYLSSRANLSSRGYSVKCYIVVDCFVLPRLRSQFLAMTTAQGS
jgi:hypothetical protein